MTGIQPPNPLSFALLSPKKEEQFPKLPAGQLPAKINLGQEKTMVRTSFHMRRDSAAAAAAAAVRRRSWIRAVWHSSSTHGRKSRERYLAEDDGSGGGRTGKKATATATCAASAEEGRGGGDRGKVEG